MELSNGDVKKVIFPILNFEVVHWCFGERRVDD